MLKERIITAAFLLMFVLAWLFITKDLYFDLITLLIALIGFYELVTMYNFCLWQKIVSIAMALSIVAIIYFIEYDLSLYLRFLIVGFWCFLVPGIFAIQPKHLNKLAVFFLGLGVFIPAFYAIIVIRTALGSYALVSIFAIAWIADTGAYFVGRAIGRHKLAPTISPGKTIEGAIGGIILVLIYLFCLRTFAHVTYLYNNFAVIKFGLIVTIISIMGDLFESWLKRVAQVKDSSNILPGHGGVFDRIDALVAVTAISYAFFYKLL